MLLNQEPHIDIYSHQLGMALMDFLCLDIDNSRRLLALESVLIHSAMLGFEEIMLIHGPLEKSINCMKYNNSQFVGRQ